MAGQRGEGPSAQQHRGALSRLTSCLAAPRFGCMRNARLPAVDQVTKTDVKSDAVVAEFDQAQAPDRQLHIAHKRSEEHTSDLQSLMRISYAVFSIQKTK